MRHSRLLLLLGVLGCGSDGGGGTPDWVPSDIDEQASLDALGTAGYARLCSAFEDYVLDMYRDSYLVEAVCTALAIEGSTTADECADSLASCKDNPPQAAVALLDQILAQASCNMAEVEPSGCAATVAEVKGCLDALSNAIRDLRFTLTCAAAGQTLDDSWWRIGAPAACTSIMNRCPPPI